MYHRRIDPKTQLINEILDLNDRLGALETAPSGDIVIRETLSTTDPSTGVSTVIGKLPSGDYGIAPYLYDIIAPPVATKPSVSAEPGTFVITWDGALQGDIPQDFTRVNVIGHKMSGDVTLLSKPVGTIATPLDSCFVSTDIATPGETWQFSLESEDYNGNRAEWGPRSDSVAMLSYASDISINQALTDATTAINNLNSAVDTVRDTANGKNKTYSQDEAPTGTNYADGDIWYDTNNDNKISRWNATTHTWVPTLIGNDGIFGNLDIGKASVGFLNTSVLKAKSIGVEKLVVTSLDNLITEADFNNNGASWGTLNSFKFIASTAGKGGLAALRITGSTALQTINNLNNKVTVGPEDRFRGSLNVKSSFDLVADSIMLKLRCYTTATASTSITIASNPLLVANTWTNFGGISPILPPNTIAVEFYIEVTNPTTDIITDIDYVSVTRAMDSKLVVDGTVTASKLESSLVLTTSVIAGDPNGTHARMDGNGFRVFAADPADGIPNEVVRMGVANTDDFFAISKADGSLAATISQDGMVSAMGVYANNSLYYRGSEMSEVLNNRAGGVRAYGDVDYGGYGDSKNVLVGSNSWYGLASNSIIMEANRVYRIVFSTPIWVFQSGGGELQLTFQLRVIDANDTSQITLFNAGTYKHFIRTMSSEGSWESDTFESTINVGPNEAGKRLQVIVGVWKGPTGAAGWIRWLGSGSFYIIDDGPRPGATTTIKNSGDGSQYSAPPAPPPPPVNTYVRQYGSYDSRSYDGGNGIYNYNIGQMYQGLSPAGVGNLKSLSLHPDMTGDLAGATINYIRVYFNFNHWYYNAGGTARIGVHGHTGIPGSFSHAGVVVISGGWPKPGARWIDIPSVHWEGFRTGAYRGISLEGDGTYNTYGYADRPTIEISFTK